MIAFLLVSLFAGGGLLALVSIAASWCRYGASVAALPRQIANCSDWREVTITTRTVIVRAEGAPILRPAFRKPPLPAERRALAA